MIICLCLLFAGRASAQWVVSDPGNLAQGIINASKNIIHTSKTATNMVSVNILIAFENTIRISADRIRMSVDALIVFLGVIIENVSFLGLPYYLQKELLFSI